MDWENIVNTPSAPPPHAPRRPSRAMNQVRVLAWALVWVVLALVLFFGWREPAYYAASGLLRGERWADGMPRNYWLAAAKEHKDPWALKALGEIGRGDPEAVQALADALPNSAELGDVGTTRAAARAWRSSAPTPRRRCRRCPRR